MKLRWLALVLVFCSSGLCAQISGFQERFLYGMVTFESGSATWVKGGTTGSAVPQGTLLPKGSVIETGKGQTGEIRLGCGSTVRLAPETRLKILPFSLEIEKGAVLTRHVGTEFPMKLEGASALIISKGSVVDVDRQKDTFIARVQLGGLKTPGLKDYVKPGQSVEASGRTAKLRDTPPEPRAWDNPALDSQVQSAPPPAADVLGDEGSGEAPSVPPTSPPTPDATPAPSPTPTSEPGDIPAEDWMRNARPAEGGSGN